MTESSIKNNQALEILNQRVSELLIDKGMIAPYLFYSSVNLFKPENKSQYNLIKDHNSVRMNIFLINTGIPVALYSNMLTFRGSKKSFTVYAGNLKTLTN